MADGNKSEELYVDIVGSSTKIQKEIKDLGDKVGSTAEQVERLDKAMNNLKQAFSPNGEGFEIKVNNADAMSKLREVQQKMKEISGKFNVEFINKNEKQPKQEETSPTPPSPSPDEEKRINTFAKLQNILAIVGKSISKVASGFGKIANAIKTAVSYAIKFASTIGKVGMTIARTTGKIFSWINPFKKIKDDSNKISGSLKSMLKRITKFGFALFGVRTAYTIIRNSALEWLNSSNAGAMQLKANLDYIKGALGTAVAPLMIYITNLVYQLMKAIQQVFFFFTGINIFSKATAKNLASGAKSAKEIKKQLADFDELHVLDFGDSSGGGGGGAVAPNIDLSTMDDFWKEFDGDWYKLGQDIGNKISEALESIDWAKIKSKADAIGTHLAELLNGIISTNLFYDLGMTLAEGFNTAMHFLYSFVSEFDFKQLGEKLAEGLKGLTDNIEWQVIALTIQKSINGLADTIYYAFEGYNWAYLGQTLNNLLYNSVVNLDAVRIGEAFGSVINAIIELGYRLLNPKTFETIGTKVGQFLNSAIQKINWKRIGETFGRFFKSIFGFISKVIEEVDWYEFGQKVREGFESIDWSGIVSGFFEMLGKAFAGISLFLAGLFGDSINGIMDYFKEKIKERGGDVFYGILEGIVDAAANLITWINDNIVQPFIEGFKSLFGIHSPSTVMAELGGYLIQGLFEGIMSLIENISEIWNTLKEDTIQKMLELKDGIIEKITTLKDNATNLWENIKTTVTDKITTLKTNAMNLWENIKTGISDKITNIKEKLKTALDSIKENWKKVWESMKTTVSNIFNNILTTIKGVINSIISAIEGMANGIVKGINKVIELLNKLSFDVPDWVPGIGGKKWSMNIPTVSEISIPRLATGGFVDKGDLFIANEAGAEWVGSMKGQTAVANNQQITQGIREASYEGMYQAIKDAGLGNIVNKVYLGTKEVTKEITKQQRSNANMFG